MKLIKTKIEGAFIIEPDLFKDDRGFFLETYNKSKYDDLLESNLDFSQDNHSSSSQNTLRGLHLQIKKPQGKLVRVVRGEVRDVIVDLRHSSKTFKKWDSFLLNEENKRQLWVPPGLAHGFLVVSRVADFEYKCTQSYDPQDEGCLIWNDPQLEIEWGIDSPILSSKDKKGLFFDDLVRLIKSR